MPALFRNQRSKLKPWFSIEIKIWITLRVFIVWLQCYSFYGLCVRGHTRSVLNSHVLESLNIFLCLWSISCHSLDSHLLIGTYNTGFVAMIHWQYRRSSCSIHALAWVLLKDSSSFHVAQSNAFAKLPQQGAASAVLQQQSLIFSTKTTSQNSRWLHLTTLMHAYYILIWMYKCVLCGWCVSFVSLCFIFRNEEAKNIHSSTFFFFFNSWISAAGD